MNELFERVNEILSAIAFRVLAREKRIISFNPEHFARRSVGLQLMRPLDKSGGALEIVYIGHSHSPIGHSANRVEGCHLSERAFGFKVPKSMQLADALIEKCLGFGMLGRDFQFHFANPWHQPGALSWSLVESLAMKRMSGLEGIG